MNTEYLKNIEEFIQDFKTNTLGITNRDFYINVLERMKNDPKYNLTEELTLQIEKVIKERDSIEDVQKDIVEPLTEYYEKAKEKTEQVLEYEESPNELEENQDISNSDSMEEENSSDINYKQYLTDFLVSVGFIKLEDNLADKNYQIAFPLQNMNMVAMMVGLLTQNMNASILFTCREGMTTLTFRTAQLNDTLQQLSRTMPTYVTDHNYMEELTSEFQKSLNLVETAMMQKVALDLGIKPNQNGLTEYVVHSTDPSVVSKLNQIGLMEDDNKLTFQTSEQEKAATILTEVNNGLARNEEIADDLENKRTNIDQTPIIIPENEELTEKNSIITIYQKPIDNDMVARITVITPLVTQEGEFGLEKQVPTADRFIELSLMDKKTDEAQFVSKRFHYENGTDFDNNILPTIADEYKQETTLTGNHFKQDPNNPMNYIIKDEKGQEKNFLHDSDNQIDQRGSIIDFIEQTDFANGANIQSRESKIVADENLDGSLEKNSKPKVLVRVKNDNKPLIGDSVAANANYIILYIIMAVQVAMLVGMFFLLK